MDGAVQLDHVVEVQLLEAAFVRAYAGSDARGCWSSMATAAARQTLVRVWNDVENTNMTPIKINQAKKGPLLRVLRRAAAGELRGETLEDAARRSRAASPLVDSGVWARIEEAMRASSDAAVEAVEVGEGKGWRQAAKLVDAQMEELEGLLATFGVA
jgi:hypothetical protein